MPPMWGHRFQCPLLQTVSARGDKSKPLRDFIVDALAACQPRRRARISIGHHRHHHHARVVQVQQPVQEQWLFGGFQSGFNVPLPLILPGRVLPGNGEVRDIFPHLDEAQLD